MEVTFPAGCKGYAGAEIPPGRVPSTDRAAVDGQASSATSTPVNTPAYIP